MTLGSSTSYKAQSVRYMLEQGAECAVSIVVHCDLYVFADVCL